MAKIAFPEFTDTISADHWRRMIASMSGDWLTALDDRETLFLFQLDSSGNHPIIDIGPYHGIVGGVYIRSDAATEVDPANRCDPNSTCIISVNPSSIRADKIDIRGSEEPPAAGIDIGEISTDADANIRDAYRYDTRCLTLEGGASLDALLNDYLALDGGIMKGTLTLRENSSPGALEAVTKEYTAGYALPASY